MSLFGALPIAATGIDAAQTWIDATAGNIANANDTTSTAKPAYQDQSVVATPLSPIGPNGVGQGVTTSVLLGNPKGQLAYQPGNPLANAQGMVRYSGVNLGEQMVNLVMAQTNYQANVAVINQAKAAYQSALSLGT